MRMTNRLVEQLYSEAMLLADEARTYFDQAGRDDRMDLNPGARVTFACESLKVTTRIMHIVAWLLTQRAVAAGEISAETAGHESRRLGHARDSDPAALMSLPEAARRLIAASIDLYDRIARLEISDAAAPSPARELMGTLQQRLAAAVPA